MNNNIYDGINPDQAGRSEQRNFFIRTYNSLSSVEELLSEKVEVINHAHYIVHNQDLVKSRHIHIVLVLRNKSSCQTIYNWFLGCIDDSGKYGNTYVEYSDDIRLCYQYLVHANDPDKERYDVSEIRHQGNSKPCLDAIEAIPEFSMAARCYKEYCSGASPQYLSTKYGAVFLKNYLNYNKARMEDKRISAVEDTLQHLRSELHGCGIMASELDAIRVAGAELPDSAYEAFLNRFFQVLYDYLDRDYSCDGRIK